MDNSLNMKAVAFSETSILFYQTTRHQTSGNFVLPIFAISSSPFSLLCLQEPTISFVLT